VPKPGRVSDYRCSRPGAASARRANGFDALPLRLFEVKCLSRAFPARLVAREHDFEIAFAPALGDLMRKPAST
jgi:hypothetical protein